MFRGGFFNLCLSVFNILDELIYRGKKLIEFVIFKNTHITHGTF